MSELKVESPTKDENQNADTPTKKTPSKRKSQMEKVAAESKELLKNMGVEELETGKRRTRSSTKAQTPTPVTPPSAKKQAPATPNSRGRGRKKMAESEEEIEESKAKRQKLSDKIDEEATEEVDEADAKVEVKSVVKPEENGDTKMETDEVTEEAKEEAPAEAKVVESSKVIEDVKDAKVVETKVEVEVKEVKLVEQKVNNVEEKVVAEDVPKKSEPSLVVEGEDEKMEVDSASASVVSVEKSKIEEPVEVKKPAEEVKEPEVVAEVVKTLEVVPDVVKTPEVVPEVVKTPEVVPEVIAAVVEPAVIAEVTKTEEKSEIVAASVIEEPKESTPKAIVETPATETKSPEEVTVSPDDRYNHLINCIIFNKIREKSPELLLKIKVIKGDISVDGLDLSLQDRSELIANVNVIFHCAACVKFDFPLKKAVNIQLTGTLRMLKLAEEMKNLNVFTYMSTAFTQQKKLEGKVLSSIWINLSSNRFLKRGHPNTYTFTKSLTEDLVHSYRDKFKITIVRPSIILSAVSEPFPGWIDSFSGPTNLIVGLYNGIFRTFLCDDQKLVKFVPVDVVVNATIVAACTTMLTDDVFYCNITDSPNSSMSWDLMFQTVLTVMRDHPLKTTISYPNGKCTPSELKYRSTSFYKHYIPCYIFDVFGIAGKIKLLDIQKKLNSMVFIFKYFTNNNFDFRTDNFRKLSTEMSSQDQQKFNCDIETINLKEYLKIYLIGNFGSNVFMQ
ncbi:unnamed protein product [Diamesa serratosioi]